MGLISRHVPSQPNWQVEVDDYDDFLDIDFNPGSGTVVAVSTQFTPKLGIFTMSPGNPWQRCQQLDPYYQSGNGSQLRYITRNGSSWLVGGPYIGYFSSDDGSTWSEIQVPPNVTYDIKFTGNSYIAVTGFSIYRSTDLTKPWEEVHFHAGALLNSARIAVGGSILAIGGDHPDGGVEAWHYSTNDGQTWSAVPPPPEFDGYILDVAYGNGRFIAVGGRAAPVAAVTKLADGSDWETIAEPFAQNGGVLSAVAFSPQSAEWLIGSNVGNLYKSQDDGTLNFKPASTTGLFGRYIHRLVSPYYDLF